MDVNKCYIPFLQSEHRYAVLKGGAGSGKSIAAVQKIILRITTEPKHRILCVRKVATTLRNSIFQLFIDKFIEYGIYNEFTINKSEMRFTHNPTKNEIILHGMDDQEKIKSIAGITSVWCEEATELDELDFNQLELRVRGATSTYKQFIVTFNPISEQHWLKKRFFDVPDDETFLMNTTYQDNSFLDDDYVNHLKKRVKSNPNLYKVYVLGEWGKVDFGGEFLKCWDTSRHTSNEDYDPTLAIWLSIDENVNPYFPCGIFQVTDDNQVRMIDELALKNPNNTVKDMGREITRKLKQWKHQGHVYICGDATSQKDDVKVEKGYDLFRLLITELQEFNPIRRVQKSNPNVRPSADFFNAILDVEEQGISFSVNEKCRTAILDFENTKEDKNGKVDKKTVIDPQTKVSYQPYGHYCVVGTTMITTNKGDVPIKDIKEGDLVLTRNGYKKVLKKHNNGYKKVVKYKIGYNELTCTPEHEIFTYNFGFKEIQKVVTISQYIPIEFCILDENKKICKKKLLSTMVDDLHVTQNQPIGQNEFISADGLLLMESKLKKGFIGINTLLRLEKYRKDTISIILTKTRLIIQSKIYSLYVVKNILQNTLKKRWQQIMNIKQNLLQRVSSLQKFGINQAKVESGIDNLQKEEWISENMLQKNVWYATKNIRQKQYNQKQNFAQIIANQSIGEEQELTTSSSCVNVEKSLLKTNIQKNKVAQENVQEVYDITVEDEHEYFANGILIHNCDLTRYLLTTIFISEYEKFQRGSLEVKVHTGRDYEFKSSNRF